MKLFPHMKYLHYIKEYFVLMEYGQLNIYIFGTIAFLSCCMSISAFLCILNYYLIF